MEAPLIDALLEASLPKDKIVGAGGVEAAGSVALLLELDAYGSAWNLGVLR